MPFVVPFIITALALTGTAAIVASIALNLVIAIGLSLVANLLLAPSVPKPADGKIAKRQSIPPRIRAFGRCRLSGAYMLYEANNGNSYDVLAVHDGIIDGVENYFLHEDEVTVVAGVVQALADGSYGGGNIQLLTRLGADPETAYSEIVAGEPGIWTTDHRGDGIASIGLICQSVKQKDFQKIYPNNLPEPSIVCRFRPCFDPRATGQDASDPTTWAWTDNPVLFLLTYLLGDMDEDYDTRILPEIDSWITAADVCDEDIPLEAGGTEKRYRAGGFYQVDNDPADVLAVILGSFDGWLGETGSGALKIFAGKFYEPTVTLSHKHITSFRVQKFVEDENAINEIVFTYTDPAQKYTEVEGDPVRDEADISARGKVRSQNVAMTWVQSHTRARRLATREMKRLSAFARGTIRTDLYGLLALGERYVFIEIPELPSLCTFPAQVSNAKIDLVGGSLTFDWILVTSEIDDWTPATDEGSPPSPGTPAGPDTIPALTGFSAISDGVTIYATFDTPTRTDLDFALRYRFTAGPGEWVDKRYDSADISGSTVTLQSPAIVPNSSYDVEVAAIGPGGTYGPYTAAVTVSTASTAVPGVPTGFTATPGVGQNTLAWNAAPATDSVTGYRIYRAAGTGGSFGSSSLVATLGVVGNWTDTGRTPGTGYTYFLKAVNAIGLSGAAGGVDCTTLAAATANQLRIPGGTPGFAPTADYELFNYIARAGDIFRQSTNSPTDEFEEGYLECEVAPTADYTISIYKNGSLVATGTIPAGLTVGHFSGLAGDVNFSATGLFKAKCQTGVDATISGITCLFVGERAA